jgi:hypothetical protein
MVDANVYTVSTTTGYEQKTSQEKNYFLLATLKCLFYEIDFKS